VYARRQSVRDRSLGRRNLSYQAEKRPDAESYERQGPGGHWDNSPPMLRLTCGRMGCAIKHPLGWESKSLGIPWPKLTFGGGVPSKDPYWKEREIHSQRLQGGGGFLV